MTVLAALFILAVVSLFFPPQPPGPTATVEVLDYHKDRLGNTSRLPKIKIS